MKSPPCKEKIQLLIKQGLYNYQIAKNLGYGRSTITKYIKIYNLTGRPSGPKPRYTGDTYSNCKHCNVNYKVLKRNKYCSNKCQRAYMFKINYQKWINGESVWSVNGALKRAVVIRDGYACKKCGIHDWSGEPISLELEHIDGDYQNNIASNLCLLCPNCHSQTPTFKSKNWGNGRKGRHSTLVRDTLKNVL